MNTIAVQVLLMHLFHTLYTHGSQVSHITGRSRPPGGVGLTPRQYTEWNVTGGVHALLEVSLSRGSCLMCTVLPVQEGVLSHTTEC